MAQARAQDLSDVLDINFVPTTPEATELFVEKQKYVYAVFEKVLLTDKGKALVRQYGPTFDAQKVYGDLCAYGNSSTRATMEASNLLSYITSSKFGDGTWKGTAHGYILHWQDQVRQYEQLLPVTSHFPLVLKRVMLENAVGQYPELRAVKIQAAQHKTQNGGVDLTYDQYCGLLLSAAQEYDGSLARNLKPPPSAARRSVYNVEFGPPQYFDEEQDSDSQHNIDSYFNDVLQINAAGFRGSPSLNADQWSRLSKEAQIKWDEFDRETKAIILEHIASLNLPIPSRFDSFTAFSGRWAGEMQETRQPIAPNGYARASAGGKPGFGGGNWLLLHAGEEVLGAHLASSTDHETRIVCDNAGAADGRAILQMGAALAQGGQVIQPKGVFGGSPVVFALAPDRSALAQTFHPHLRESVLPARAAWVQRW